MWGFRAPMLLALVCLLAPAISASSLVDSGAMSSNGNAGVPQLRCVFHFDARDETGIRCIVRGRLRDANQVTVLMPQPGEAHFVLDEFIDASTNFRRQLSSGRCFASCFVSFPESDALDAELFVHVKNRAAAGVAETIVFVDERVQAST